MHAEGVDNEGDVFMHAEVMRAINVQINSEFSAWYQYLAMAAFCEREKFTGAARWLKAQSAEEYQHGMKLFDFVNARNGAVELTRIEFDLLDTLSASPKVVFTRAQLLERVWGPDWYADDHVVDVHVANLRKKIDRPGAKSIVRTVRGVGYGITA